jgi:predicted kinase
VNDAGHAPVLIVVSGLPGSGKSTLADGIGAARRAAVLSVDPIESAILRAGVAPSFETGLAAYLVAEACAEAALAAGLDAVVDAVSSVETARSMWRSLAARHGAALRVIVCALDAGEAARRIAGRDRGLATPEPDARAIAAREAEWTPWPERHLRLDSSVPAADNLARALAWLDAAD